jgi:cytochrome P450
MIDHENNDTSSSNKNTNDESDYDSNLKWHNPLKKTLTTDEIIAQAFSFLIGGYETTDTALCFVAYNLATNLKYQDKLISEIDQVLEKYVS